MGLETTCKGAFNGTVSEGKLQWEGDVLLFRGDFRLKLAASDIRQVSVDGQELVVEFGTGTVTFALGPQAAKWHTKIAKPPTLMDKLGIKSGQRIAMLNWTDKAFREELRGRDIKLVKAGPCDIVFLGAERDADLETLHTIEPMLLRNGAIWIVYPKGQKQITELSVMAATKAAGYVDNKTCRFSVTHTGLRAVIPVARR